MPDLRRKLAAEFLGTALLLATVVGSGIMAESLAGGNVGIALLGNTIPTGASLIVLIWVFGPVSGAHFNPAVTAAFLIRREIGFTHAGVYVVAQVAGAILGVMAAHATFGLVVAILGTLRWGTKIVAASVGLYITAAYWFTASTSFANPAVTVGRMLTDSFSGILPQHAPAFIAAQFAGAVVAVVIVGWLLSPQSVSVRETAE